MERVLPETKPDIPKPPPRTLVTSALPYANGHVHIGHLAGAYLPADIYARYLRAKGADVAFICGSDEHGVPITITAEREGTTPQAIIDRYHSANAEAFAAARVEFDIYDRTSGPRHHELTRYFFTRLRERGHIDKRDTEQLYCEKCERFLPDRFVEGRCHHDGCGAPGARGDQCDKCGRVVEALKLIDPECSICRATPIVKTATHWFLKLSDFQEQLGEWLGDKKHWRSNVRQGALGWVKEGLRDRAITRDLSWGVKVPLDEAEGKVIYVWFDAPIGYVTFTKIWAESQGDPDRWKDFWQNPASEIVHFIGKDNIPFHAITWPAMIMGVGDGTELPSHIVANEYLNLGEGKFSKSLGRIIRIIDFARAFGADALRYYITAVSPESSDSEFTWEDFRKRYGELADTLGNFCHRGLSFARKWTGGKVPDAKPTPRDEEATREAAAEFARADENLRAFRFKAALHHVMEIARIGNRHFDEREPWKTRKTDPSDCESAIATSLAIVRGLAVALHPFLPDAADRLTRSLGSSALPVGPGSWESGAGVALAPAPAAGAELGEPEVLFPKMDDATFEEKVARATESDR